MAENPKPNAPASELSKLGTGVPIDDVKLHEEMEEARMSKLIETTKKAKVGTERPAD